MLSTESDNELSASGDSTLLASEGHWQEPAARVFVAPRSQGVLVVDAIREYLLAVLVFQPCGTRLEIESAVR